jgi:hypothetical protein
MKATAIPGGQPGCPGGGSLSNPSPVARSLATQAAAQELSARVASQGAAICRQYGPRLGWSELLRLLEDRTCTPYPCEVRFEAGPLLPGEFAHAVPKGLAPEEGFRIYLHPLYAANLSQAVYLVLHQLVLVNHGEAAGAEAAELFGALALGITQAEYYQVLCELSGRIGGDELI